MRIRLSGLPERCRPGMDAFLSFHGIVESSDGLPIRITVREGGALRISRTEDGVALELPDAGRVFRALTYAAHLPGLLPRHAGDVPGHDQPV